MCGGIFSIVLWSISIFSKPVLLGYGHHYIEYTELLLSSFSHLGKKGKLCGAWIGYSSSPHEGWRIPPGVGCFLSIISQALVKNLSSLDSGKFISRDEVLVRKNRMLWASFKTANTFIPFLPEAPGEFSPIFTMKTW